MHVVSEDGSTVVIPVTENVINTQNRNVHAFCRSIENSFPKCCRINRVECSAINLARAGTTLATHRLIIHIQSRWSDASVFPPAATDVTASPASLVHRTNPCRRDS